MMGTVYRAYDQNTQNDLDKPRHSYLFSGLAW